MSHAYSVKQSEDICKTLNALQLGKVFPMFIENT